MLKTNRQEQNKLPRDVVRLSWISFFNDISSDMLYPLIPMFMSAHLGASAKVLGLVEGFADALVNVIKAWSGSASDRNGKRMLFVRWGYGLSCVAKPLLGLATFWPFIFICRSADKVGKGLRTTARDALITDIIKPGQEGRAFGLNRALDNAGAFCGVICAFFLMRLFEDNYQTVFLISAIPGSIVIFLTFRIRDKARFHAATPVTESLDVVVKSKEPLSAGYWKSLGLLCFFALCNSTDMFLLLYAGKVLGYSTGTVVLFYGFYNLMGSAVAYSAGRFGDRRNPWRLMQWGWLLYAAVYLGLAHLGSNFVWPLFACYGFYYGITAGTSKAIMARHSPAGRKGYALGFYNMAEGFCFLLAGLLTGWVWDAWSPQTALSLVGVMALLVLGVSILLTDEISNLQTS